MHKKIISLFIVIIISIFSIFTGIVFAEDNWQKEFSEEGITVYTRPVEGLTLREFKGEAVINAPLTVCLNVLEDIENHTKWRPDCIVSKLLKKDNDNAIAYFENKEPWPVSNRDFIIKTTASGTKDKVVLNFTAVDDPGLEPLKKDVVRLTEVTGMWILISNGNDTIVIYQAKINPSGSIPAWLANKTSKEQPLKTLKGLMRMVEDPEYKDK